MLVVAALLLTASEASAAAIETPEHHSKNAQKVIRILKSLGMNAPEVKDFVDRVDSHVKGGYLNLSEQKILGGNMVFRYRLKGGAPSRQLQLSYKPDDSHIEALAETRSVTVYYRLKF